MTMFRLRFRVESSRHPEWDYHLPGYYFVTICIRNRLHYFGVIKNHQMELSVIGNIARPKKHFGPQSDNLPAIVRGFKSAVKKRTNIQGLEFHWQPRYHDHIIRADDELNRIRHYIKKNIETWDNDSQNR